MIALQIILGLGIIVLSVVIQVVFIELASQKLAKKFGGIFPPHPDFGKFVLTVSALTLWLLIGLLVTVVIWTGILYALSAFDHWEESFYFSLVAFTTLGFGDITLPDQYRLLSGFIATDGFLLFGLNTAVLLEAMIRLRAGPRP